MKKYDVVMFNMSGYAEWQRGVSNRNYHVLHEVMKSDEIGKILAVDYPPMTLKRAMRNYKENIVPLLDGGQVLHRSWVDKLTKLSDKLYVYTNSEYCLRPSLFVDRVKGRLNELGFENTIVWSFFPPVMPYLKNLGQKLTIFDAVDNWAEHPSYTRFKEELQHAYQYVKHNADVIFTVAEDLQGLFDHQPNVYWIPNGVDVGHYQKQHVLLNRDIADIPKPIIGYIGVIQDRVDIDLIKYLASKNPTKSFVIVGPVWKEVDEKSLREHSNIYLLGYKSYQEAPQYIQQFDVGIIPHRPSAFVTSTNPMKMYEYLACGKPVVATKGAGAEMLKDVVYIADDPNEFNRKIFLAMEEDSEDKQAERRRVVEDYTWGSVVGNMLDIVRNKLNS